MRQRLTDLGVERIKAPKSGRLEIWDSLLPRFGLRVTANGRKSWVVMYRMGGRKAPKRRLTLGPYPALSLAAARKLAKGAFEQIAEGKDPEPRSITPVDGQFFPAVAAEFIERYAKENNKGWKRQESDIQNELVPHWKFKKITAINRRDVIEILDRVCDRASAVRANRVLALMRRFFSWCIERDILVTSPAAGLKPPGKEVSRDRVLSDDELNYVWRAFDALGYPFGGVGKLLLITAQRRDEVGHMRWEDLDLGNAMWTVPKERSKNGVANEVPLAALALKLLAALPRQTDNPYVFPAMKKHRSAAKPKRSSLDTTGSPVEDASKAHRPISGYGRVKRRLDRLISEHRKADAKPAMPPWWFHDLRRAAASSMARLGVAPHVIERVLNHISGSQSGVAGIYNRYGYLPEKKAALEMWHNHLMTLLNARVDH